MNSTPRNILFTFDIFVINFPPANPIVSSVCVYDELGFRSVSLPRVAEQIKKTKLQTHTEPQTGASILCAPSVSAGIVSYQIFQRVKVSHRQVGEAC